ncbi:MAG: ABC-2 family transporter protein [Nanoarchaeota archaeon]|nr:ABC-2 family transporter protein [Nanoarchaeota archaeon]
MKRYIKLFFKSWALEISSHIAYKANFVTKMIAIMIMDLVGPLVVLLIYTNTAGIPGWTLEEFILFQGTMTLVFGFGHGFIVMMPVKILEDVREGHFDRHLVKPFNTLKYFLFSSPDIDGFAEIFVGLSLITWAFIKLDINIVSLNFLLYIVLILTGLLFQYTLFITVSALTFLFVKSWALFDILFTLQNFARYPLNVYNSGLVFFLTFLFPIAVSAFYPVEVLLRGLSWINLIKVILPVVLAFCISVWFWNKAMKKYSSAGG